MVLYTVFKNINLFTYVTGFSHKLTCLQGAGTDENCLIDILASRTTSDIFQMKEAYLIREYCFSHHILNKLTNICIVYIVVLTVETDSLFLHNLSKNELQLWFVKCTYTILCIKSMS